MDRGPRIAGTGGHLFSTPPFPAPAGFQSVALANAPGIARRRSAHGETPMAAGVLSRATHSHPPGAGRHRPTLAGASHHAAVDRGAR